MDTDSFEAYILAMAQNNFEVNPRSTQMSPSTILMIIQHWLSDYDLNKPDDEQAPTILDERLFDLENAMSQFPESIEHLQSLRNNSELMHKASKEQRLEDGRIARKAALSACGSLQEIREKNNLA
jgi:hypothetical protein